MKTTNELKPYARDKQGRWSKKTRWEFVIFWIFFIGTVGAYIHHTGFQASQAATRGDGGSAGGVLAEPADLQEGCTKTSEGYYECSSKDALAKWKTFLESEIEKLKVDAGKPTAVLTKVCRVNGITDSNCPKILYAMALQESGMGKWMSGDNGHSHGFFHILDIHKVAKSCTHDLFCSADWSLKRMIRLGFNDNRDNAIRLHNGGLSNPVTLSYLHSVKSKMNSWPQ